MVDDAPCDGLAFEERMGSLLGAESSARRDRKVAKYVKQAGSKTPSACVKDAVHLPDRTLNKDRIARCAGCERAEDCEVMVVISKTGGGKSLLCRAFGDAACRKLVEVRCTRLAGICEDLDRARAASDGSRYEPMDGLKTVPPLIVDDFMTTPTSTQNAVDSLETMEARESLCATFVASQLEPNERYLRIEGELMADSILNRIATEARYIDLEGPNMRECFAKKKAE